MRTDRYRFVDWTAQGISMSVPELYDHQTDPQETVNVANLPENEKLVGELRNQLSRGWKAANAAGR